MEFISEFLGYWWNLCTDYYRVNPVLFITMYSIKSVIFWWTIIYIVKLVLQKKWNSIPFWVFLNVSTNVSPWVYIWICGENLPFRYSYMVYFVGGWALCYLVWDVRRRLKEQAALAAGLAAEGEMALPE